MKRREYIVTYVEYETIRQGRYATDGSGDAHKKIAERTKKMLGPIDGVFPLLMTPKSYFKQYLDRKMRRNHFAVVTGVAHTPVVIDVPRPTKKESTS
jgi:hypothetical protein